MNCKLLMFLLILLTLFGCDSSVSNQELEDNNDNKEVIHTPEPIIYHSKNEHINRLLTNYNKIAEYDITPEIVETKQYKNDRAFITIENVWVQIYTLSTRSGLLIEIEDETYDDKIIEILFRDFCKAISPQLTQNDIILAWNNLKSGEHGYYDEPIVLMNLECTYFRGELKSGKFRYSITISCGTYY